MSTDSAALKEEILIMSNTDPKKCMGCGKCSATCPPGFDVDVSPFRFVKYALDGNFERLLESKILWKCLSCFACVERCPRGVEPAALIEAVRLICIRKRDGNYLRPDDIPDLVKFDEDIPQQLIVSALRKYSK